MGEEQSLRIRKVYYLTFDRQVTRIFDSQDGTSKCGKGGGKSTSKGTNGPSIFNVEASVTGPPESYTRSGRSSTRTTTENGPAQNTTSAKAASSEHLTRMMEVVAHMEGKTDTYQRESLIELVNLVLDKDT